MCKKLVVVFGIIAVVLSMSSVYAVPIKPCLTLDEWLTTCAVYSTSAQIQNCQNENRRQLCLKVLRR